MRYAIVGLGGIGTSIGLALRKADPSAQVLGYDLNPDATAGALSLGALTDALSELTACASVELIVLATPPSTVGELLSAFAPHLVATTVLTEVASVKMPVLAEVEGRLAFPSRFVGGHPIAGTEHSGWQSARADLFRGAQWVLTPTDTTDAEALDTVEQFVRKLGAIPLRMDAQRHDREMALLSHLPHIVAFSLSALHRQCPTQLQGGGSWQSATRVAHSDPALWSEILSLNREALAEVLRLFQTELGQVLALLEQGDSEGIRRWLEQARLRSDRE